MVALQARHRLLVWPAFRNSEGHPGVLRVLEQNSCDGTFGFAMVDAGLTDG